MHHVVVHPLTFLPRTTNAEYNRLFVGHSFGFREPIDRLFLELRCKNRSAVVYAIVGNHHNENASRSNPPRDMFQEKPLHALVLPFADFKVIGWIEIDERERIYRGVSIE